VTRRLYFDHNASHPLRPAARSVLEQQLSEGALGNPSSAHLEGRRARALLEDARERLAATLDCPRDDVVFTSGGSESNGLALCAVAGDALVVASATEHPSVLVGLERRKRHALLPVSSDGQVSAEHITQLALPDESDNSQPGVALVSVAWANHETGQLQDVEVLARATHDMGALFHSDACQAVGRVPLSVALSGVDLLSVSSHKLGGPPGIGALVASTSARPQPMILGGGQEDGLRAGTESAVLAAAFAAAAEQACEERERLVGRWLTWKRELRAAIKEVEPDVVFYSAAVDSLANTLCVSFPGRPGATLVQRLDLAGVSVSHGSACASGSQQASPVLAAMGVGPALAGSSIRITMGRDTTSQDVALLAYRLANVLQAVPVRGAPRKNRRAERH
jgi:cysteine desulfurase